MFALRDILHLSVLLNRTREAECFKLLKSVETLGRSTLSLHSNVLYVLDYVHLSFRTKHDDVRAAKLTIICSSAQTPKVDEPVWKTRAAMQSTFTFAKLYNFD